ncbi:MAG: DUF4870 domain-containing protein [Oscillospiraceae bacterium]|nr:DUF4870 domain-containing protein [Oscillospiraceae bacterium]
MAFCGNCGAQTQEGASLCAACDPGTAQTPAFTPIAPAATDETRDAEENKLMGVLAYCGPLALLPFFTKKDSPFAQFHAKQGITLCILWIGYLIVRGLLGLIKITRTEYVWGVPVEYTSKPWFITLITSLLAVGVSLLAIIGIINAIKGEKKPLPLIGGISIIK